MLIMECPNCTTRMKCVDTRHYNDKTVRRRYSCEECNHRYSSVEEVVHELGRGVHGVYETRAEMADRIRREAVEDLVTEMGQHLLRG